MNREKIFNMACKSGSSETYGFSFDRDELLAFAALIASDCASLCDDLASMEDEHGIKDRAMGAGLSAQIIRHQYKL